jgi:hypothetical protein
MSCASAARSQHSPPQGRIGSGPPTAGGPPAAEGPDGAALLDWNAVFGTLRELDFDGVATACVFAWEERPRESSAFLMDRITEELAR